jgi:GH25 family lysozyme M1 (1,4-beta-N-acetylmuramidase)
MNDLGFDISSGDGVIDWQLAYSRGIRFATIRATIGVNAIDERYAANMSGALSVGIKRMPYHWLNPRLDHIAQANWFYNHSQYAELGRMIDLEDSGIYYHGYHGIWAKIKAFCDLAIVDNIYLSPSYCKAYLYDCPQLNQYKLLIANWDVAAPGYCKPIEPTRWTAWQYTGKAYGPYYGIQALDAAMYVWNGQVGTV